MKKAKLFTLTAALAVIVSSVSAEPVRLRTEFLENPLAVDTTKPRFSWIVENTTPGARQTAYQIQAASSAETLAKGVADLWESGRVDSSQSHLVEYGGTRLASRQQVYWRVKVWDQEGRAGDWSAPVRFEIALLDPGDWVGQWIAAGLKPANSDASNAWVRMTTVPVSEVNLTRGDSVEVKELPPAAEREKLENQSMERLREVLAPCPLFRREFEVDREIKRARAYVAAPGFFRLHVNGEIISDRELEPGVFPFRETVLYSVHDITGQLRQGNNAVGLELGHGFFANHHIGHVRPIGDQPLLLAQLEIEYTDGEVLKIGTDTSWKTAPGPTLIDQHWLGECRDARLEAAGWDQPGFDDGGWAQAQTSDFSPKSLAPDLVAPGRVVRRITPQRLFSPVEGVWVYDMGEAFSGAAELKVNVPAGTVLTLRYSQHVYMADEATRQSGVILYYPGREIDRPLAGLLFPRHHMAVLRRVGPARMLQYAPTDVYVASGGGEETWRRQFGYAAYRYVELVGYPGEPSLDTVTGIVVHSDLPRAGSFSSSSEALNEIHAASVNSFLYSTHGFTQDNPSREKQYCPEMTAGSARLAATLFPMTHLWRKMVESSLVTQDPTGHYDQFCGFRNVPEQPVHEDGPIRLTYLLWERYGDERLLHASLDAHAAYFDYYWDNPQNQRPEAVTAGNRTLAAEDLSVGYLRGGHFCFDWYADQKIHDLDLPKNYFPPRGQIRPLWGTGFLLENLEMFLAMARHAGRTDLLEKYTSLRDKVRDVVHETFYDPETGSYGAMGENALALSAGFVPEEQRPRVVASIVNDIGRLGGRLATGTHGTPRIVDALSANGHAGLVIDSITRETYPGLTHMLKAGHRTFFENPDLFNEPHGTNVVQSERGRLGFWFAEWLGGIRPDPAQPGYRHFVLAPVFPPQLEFISAEVPSPYGTIASAWQREGNAITWNVTIPWNTTATVNLPGHGGITVNGKPQEKSEFDLPAGKWEIVSKPEP